VYEASEAQQLQTCEALVYQKVQVLL